MNISFPVLNLKQVKRSARDGIIPTLTTLAIFGLIFIQSSRGFDFSDEGLYILALDSSRLNQVFHTPFHIPLRFVWFGSGEDVFVYRFLSALILLAICWIWAESALRLFGTDFISDARVFWLSLIVALIFIPFYGLGLPTPSYNFLTYLGSLLVTAGVFRVIYLAKSIKPKWGIRPAALISAGLAVSSFGKFSVPLILAGASFAIVIWAMQTEILKAFRFLILTFLMFLVFVSILSLPLTPLEVGNLFVTGIQNVITMDSTYAPLNSIRRFVGGAVSPVVVSMGLFAIFFLLLPRVFSIGIANVQVSFLFFAVAVGFATTATPNTTGFAILVMVFVLAVLFSLKIFGKGDLWPPFVFVSLASVAPAIGGNNGFALVGMYLGPLIAVSAILLSRDNPKRRSHLKVIFSLFMVLLSTATTALEFPYRQLPLSVQSESISVGSGALFLDSDRSRVVLELRSCLRDKGLTGSSGLDFTTNLSAGLIYLLGLKTPENILGTVWGYDGSEILMKNSVRRLSLSAENILLLTQTGSENARLESARRILEDRVVNSVPVCSSGEWGIYQVEKLSSGRAAISVLDSGL